MKTMKRDKLIPCSMIKFFLLMMTTTGTDNDNSSFILQDDWDTLCPYTDICHHKASQNITLSYNKKPCCESCSCEEDCGLYKNCCQYSMDKYRLDEKYKTKCTSLTSYTKGSLQYISNMYTIVDECPNTTSCYDFTVSQWGSMYPVASDETKMIYLNKMCALCHGIKGVQLWNVELNCNLEFLNSIYINDALESYVGKFINTGMCDIRFIPPEKSELKFKRCFVYPTISECLLKEFSDKIDTKTQQLCYSYNATYSYLRSNFANIHCFLCSSKRKVKQICDSSESLRLPPTPLSFLLTGQHHTEADREMFMEQDECHMCYCKNNEVAEKLSGSCRQLRCPVAMLEINRKCAYITDTLTAGPLLSFLKLQPVSDDGTIRRDEVIKLAEQRRLFPNVLRAWTQDIFIPYGSSSVKYFIVRLMYPRANINIKSFINNFKKSIDTHWFLNIRKQKFAMKPIIHKHFNYLICNITNEEFYLAYAFNGYESKCEKLEQNSAEKLEGIRFEQHSVDKNPLLLTKFYFCKQVDLKETEYETQGDKILFTVTNKTYEQIEFRNVSSEGVEMISLCKSDFGEDFWLFSGSVESSSYFRTMVTTLVLYLNLAANKHFNSNWHFI